VLVIGGCSYTPPRKLTMVDYYSGIKQEVERKVALQRLEKLKVKKDNQPISKKRKESLFYQKEATQYIEKRLYQEALNSLKGALTVEEDIYWSKKENINRKKFATNCSAIKARQEKFTKYLQKECRNHTILNAPQLGDVYYKLAFVYSMLNKDMIALAFYEKSLEAKRIDIIGKDTQDTADFYNNFSLFLNKIKAYKRAFYYQKQASEIYLKLKQNKFKVLTNDKKKSFLDKETYGMYNIVSLAFDYKNFLDAYLTNKPYPHNKDADFSIEKREIPKEKIEVLETAFKFWLSTKGEISNKESYLLDFKKWGASSEGKLLVDIYLNRTREYSNLMLSKLVKGDSFDSNEQKKLEDVTNERNILEEYLTPYIDNYSSSRGELQFKHPEIMKLSILSKNMSNNELYLDFIKTKKYFYLFTFDNREHLSLYRLNRVTEIEALVKKFREKIKNERNIQEIASTLYKILFGQISNLHNYKQLIVSPDGLLNLLPFESLINDSKRYLIQDSSVVYALSGRELFKTRGDDRHALSNREIVSLSYVDYKFNNKSVSITDANRHKGRRDIDGIFHDFEGLPRLESSKDEGVFMKNIFETNRSFIFHEKNITKNPVTILTEKNATKEMLFALKSPQILHLSTHSFYGKDDSKRTLNPLLKSAIALSEYNAIVLDDDTRGIMSALEFSTLNLKNTELVLFSSCQSGLGDIYSSEGVSGLNRGARMTGASRVISTLWSVDEDKSLKLTKTFYRYLVNSSTTHTLGHQYRDKFHYAYALQATKLDMINQKLHPFYWAGFIMYGLDSFYYKKVNKFYSDMLDKEIDKAIEKPINKAVDKLFNKLFKF